MTCVLPVLISLLKLSCIQRGLFCLIRIVSIAAEQLLIMQQAIQNSLLHYMAALITLDAFGFVFTRGKNIHFYYRVLVHIAMATILLMLELLCAHEDV